MPSAWAWPRRWQLRTETTPGTRSSRAAGGFYHNRYNQLAGSSTGGLANVSGTLSYTRYSRTSLFTVHGWASSLFISSFSRTSWAGTATGRKELSDKANMRFGAGVANGFNYQNLILRGVLFADHNVLSSFATTGFAYDFTPSTSGFLDVHYNKFRFDTAQRIDGSEYVFQVPNDDEVLIPNIPVDIPFSTDTTENVIDASNIAEGLLGAEGTLEREFVTESVLVTGGVSHNFTDRTDAGAQIGYRWRGYERPGNDFAGGDTFFTLKAGHDFNSKTDMSAIYTFRRNEIYAPTISSHTVVGRFHRQISTPITFEGWFGLTHYYQPDFVASGDRTIGGLSVSGAFARTSFHVSYQRRFQHSTGVGRYLTSDFASAGMTRVISRDWRATAFTGYRRSGGTFDRDFSYTVILAGTNATYRLTEDVGVGASYLFRYLDYRFANYDTHLVSVFATFGKRWK